MVDEASPAAVKALPHSATPASAAPAVESERLLAARFAVPAQPADLVDRPRLIERLQEGMDRPLTLVSSPAGTGKTTAVAAWASSGRVAGLVVWISLDEADLAGSSLWWLIVEGLRRKGVRITRRPPVSQVDPPDRTFLTSLAAEIRASREPVVLVLDCDGPLTREDASGLDYLLRHGDDHFRVVQLSRSDPVLPLHRYRLAGTMLEIRMADLAFTAAEAAELLARKGVELPRETTHVVTRKTQGWAAGLVMTAMSLAHRADPEDAARQFTGDTGAVAEYLLAEVLDAQPAAARELLLSTSVVDLVRPGLVEVLAGPGAPRALTFLAHGNAFLEEIPESIGCYRYHPLFRELLRAQLSYESPAKALDLHRKAAHWMAEHGLLAEAVRQAAAGEAWEDAARYVVEDLAIGQLVVELHPGGLADSFAGLPDDVQDPSVSLVRAARALARSDVPTCARELSTARRRTRAGHGHTPAAELAAGLLTLMRDRATGDDETALEAAAAVEQLVRRVDPTRLAAHPEIVAIVGACRGSGLLLAGRLGQAAEAFSEGAAVTPRPGCECPTIDCVGHLALLAALSGRLRKAVSLAQRAIELEAESGIPRAACPSAAQAALAWVHTETCDISRARHHLEQAAEASLPHRDPLMDVALVITTARVRRAAGDLQGAQALLAEGQSATDAPPWLVDRLRVEEAALDIRAGEPGRAAAVVAHIAEPAAPEAALVLAETRLASGENLEHPVPTPSAQQSSLTARVDGWLLEAWHRLRRGQESAAIRALDKSLRLAAPERMRRPFREAPRDVRRLLRQHDDLARQHGWLDAEVTATAGPVPRQRAARPGGDGHESPVLVVEPLTEKEREVLGHLAQLLTTEEIAAAMFVSVNTVRTHVRNILRKLSASRRNEAVRRARELGIVPHTTPGTTEPSTPAREVTPRG